MTFVLNEHLRDAARRYDRPAVVSGRTATDWLTLAKWADEFADTLTEFRGRRVAMRMRHEAGTFSALAALEHLKCDVLLLDDGIDANQEQSLASEFDVEAILDVQTGCLMPEVSVVRLTNQSAGNCCGTVTILTSGTSGRPKAARHHWAGLARPIRRTSGNEIQRWLLTYRPHLYAGLQVILQCFVNYGILIFDDSEGDVRALCQRMLDAQVGYASATPSYWRKLFLLGDQEALLRVPLVQITLGGEPVDDSILAILSNVFPNARIVHIYATTELGRCFSVTDGRAGFPCRFLDSVSSDGVEMKIEDGELLVKSKNRMDRYDAKTTGGVTITDDGWTRTGDMVEVRGDRVYFIGRRSDVINVGGHKVSPVVVEKVIRKIPGVSDVRVFGTNSSIAGQLVACEVVPEMGVDSSSLREAIACNCRIELAPHQRPRLISIVDGIELTSAGKVRRCPLIGDSA